jgi:hypothetical protein
VDPKQSVAEGDSVKSRKTVRGDEEVGVKLGSLAAESSENVAPDLDSGAIAEFRLRQMIFAVCLDARQPGQRPKDSGHALRRD